VYRLLAVKKVNTAAYRPQTNGLVERFNRTLATMISMYVDSKHRDWDRYIPYLIFAYNTTIHPATKESPFFLMYGREPRLPIDVALRPRIPLEEAEMAEYRAELIEGLKLAREHGREALRRTQQERERLAEKRKRNVVTYGEGQQVMVKNPAFVQGGGPTKKLLHTWTGPFRVIRRMGETTYLVEGVNREGRAVSSNRLKLYHSSAHPEGDPADYAHHFEDAGEGHPGEGNRTYEPTMTEQQMAAAEEEAKRKQLEDPGGALGGDDAPNSSSEEEDSWGGMPNLVETSEGQVGDHIWNENCQECEGAGKVYPCYSCNCVWHPRCLVRKVMPRGLQAHEELVCPECVREVTQEEVSPMFEVSHSGDSCATSGGAAAQE